MGNNVKIYQQNDYKFKFCHILPNDMSSTGITEKELFAIENEVMPETVHNNHNKFIAALVIYNDKT